LTTFVSLWFTRGGLGPSSAVAATRVLVPGAWSYFGDPRAVHGGGKTFIRYTGTDGYIRLVEIERGP